MGGRGAIRGFEYQFLCTLEYMLSEAMSSNTDVTEVQVEGVLTADLHADQEIVDFALTAGEHVQTVAQVKSGSVGSSLTATQVLEMLVRLLSHTAEQYLVVTNRSAVPNLRDLLALMRSGEPDIREDVLALVGRSKVAEKLPVAGHEFWERLRRTEVVLDSRNIEQVRIEVQDLVRAARHRVAPSTIGWDATGLLTGFLVWEVMARAAGPQGTELAMSDLLEALSMDADTLKALMPERDWAVPVTPAPRAADIARPEMLARISECLPVPVPRDAAPVCLLAGLSGIGKSSLAAAWADDNAYAYAAIMWIDATNQAQIAASFAAVAEWFQSQGLIPGGQTGVPLRERVFAALARSARPWLMVFDNCADQTVVRNWIPSRGYGHIIVTSTDQSPLSGPSTAKIDVHGMTDGEATQLLTRRVLGNRQPNDDEQRAIEHLAARLHHWPLALELAATYLVSTLLEHTNDLSRSVASFDRLLTRAMDDRPSVPLSYPDTVVGAITLTWQRIVERTGPAETLATNALRSAAFLASRQIPLHLLLACAAQAPVPLIGDGVVAGLACYTRDDPPVGEVVREMKRDSLVTSDEPVPFSTPPSVGETQTSAEALGISVAMNDIVQFIVRSLVDREGSTTEVVSRLTFYTQAWLQYITSTNNMHTAVSMVGHAIELSDHVIEQCVSNPAAPLLWGNTAGILGYLDEWTGAAHYLSAELAYLDSAVDSNTESETSLLRIQTLVALAEALYQRADDPRDVVHRIVPLLERFITEVPSVVPVLHDAAAKSIRAASATVMHLLHRSIDDPRLTALQSALSDFRRMVPINDEVDWYAELHRLNAMIRAGNHAGARAAAEAMLPTMNPAQPEYLQTLRVVAETCVTAHDWPAARDILTRFAEVARTRSLRKFEISVLLRNVGINCLFAMMYQEDAAFELFDSLNRIAEIADSHGVVLHAGDRDLVSVFRALHTYLENNAAECANWLDGADLDAIDSVERLGLFRILHRLLSNWCIDKTRIPADLTFEPPEKVFDYTFGNSPHPVPDTVLPLDENEETRLLLNLGAESAPARAVGSAQVKRAAERPPRDPLEIAVETCLALRILGLPAQIAEVFLQVLRDGPGLNLTDPERLMLDNPANAHASRAPHHVAWVESSGHLVDPAVPQLYAIRAVATTRTAHRHPVVVPFPPEREFPVLRRDGLLIAYNHINTYDVQDVAKTLQTDRRTACETNAVFIALHAVIALGTTGAEHISTIETTHPALAGLIIRPERLTDLETPLVNVPRGPRQFVEVPNSPPCPNSL